MEKEILEQASDWVDREDELSGEQQRLLLRWLAESPDHKRAYDEMKKLYHSDALSEALLVQSKSPISLKMPFIALAASVLLVAGLMFFLAIPSEVNNQVLTVNTDVNPISYRTDIAELENKPLPDGSFIFMSANSSMDYEEQVDWRKVNMHSGQIYFDVQSDPQRSFIVNIGNTEIRVVGTEFDVQRWNDTVDLQVYEGEVRISSGMEHLSVTAGHRISVVDDVLQPIKVIPQGKQLPAWRMGWLEADAMPLTQVVANLQNYSPEKIMIESDVDSQVKITGRFELDETLASLTLIANSQKLSVQESQGQILVKVAGSE